MASRFRGTGKKQENAWGLVIFVLVFAALLTGAAFYFSGLSRDTLEQQRQSLEAQVMRSVMQCYAWEGRYPESLSKLTDSYGLVYDESRFYVDYQPVAENLLPDVTVLSLGGAQ